MHWYGSGMSGWGYALMTISVVLILGLVTAGIVAVVRYLGRTGQQGSASPAPEQLLAQRFARGEIDEEEYRRRLDVPHSGGRPLARS